MQGPLVAFGSNGRETPTVEVPLVSMIDEYYDVIKSN